MPKKHKLSLGRLSRGLFLALLTLASSGPVTLTSFAGDLLRGGYTPGTNASGTTVPGSFTSPSVTAVRQNAQDLLSRTTAAVQAVQAMQSQARQLAIVHSNNLGADPNHSGQTLPNVPDGLNTGGLVPDSGLASAGVSNPVPTWTGISGPPTQATTPNGNTLVTVVQNAADAILNWNTFNIGKHTTLNINQNAGGADESSWIAFNIIKDPSDVPSQILGAIQAGGQVYVINQNGIIFGGSSQVNVHTLVASSLPIDTFLIGHGILNDPDDQFLFSALAQPAGTLSGAPAMAGVIGAIGNVTVEAGAQITAPANADNVGGRVALIGPNVTNDGTISTPDGQTILAAGLQVGFAAHSSSDPSLRGLDVYVGQVASSAYTGPAAGTAINDGLISSPRGDTYITGAKVEQMGDIYSTTSVSLNGRIDLVADYGANPNPANNSNEAGSSALAPYIYTLTGNVILGADSVSEILPQIDDSETVVGTSLALPSKVFIQGQAIDLQSNATILAPNAAITLDAGEWGSGSSKGDFLFGATATSSPQIYIDNGATINAAGTTDVSESVLQNIIAVQLRGTELADDPLQRNGVFRGQTIYIDIREQGVYGGIAWVGTPLANASGYAALVESTVAALTIGGGTVALNSGGSVVMQQGSSVNVSGGYVNYQGGVVDTSRVITAGGQLLDISAATPDQVYRGIFTGQFDVNYLKYGLSSTFTDPIPGGGHYEDGYDYGGPGGQITIQTPSAVLNGSLVGLTVAGQRQRSVLPTASSLSLTFESQDLTTTQDSFFSPTPPAITIENDPPAVAVGSFTLDSAGNPEALTAAEQKSVFLSPDLTESDGFGAVTISDVDGDITVASSVNWTAEPTGAISLSGANVTVLGSITIPQGSITLNAYDLSPFDSSLSGQSIKIPETPDLTRGAITLGSSAVLDTAGLIVDDRPESAAPYTQPVFYSGGSVAVTAYNADLDAGSLINVSGGVDLAENGSVTYGSAGSISIIAGKDPNFSIIGGHLNLGSTLEGYSGSKGGSLTIQDSFIQIGGDALNAETLALGPSFFSQGGFDSFTVAGLGSLASQPAVYITPGTTVNPVSENYVLSNATQLSGAPSPMLTPMQLPEESRTPVSITFSGVGVQDTNTTGIYDTMGSVVEGAGATVQVDPLGSISFKGNSVAIFGAAIAPAGTISVASNGNPAAVFLNVVGAAVPTVELGPDSLLSAAGVVVPTANAYGYNTGRFYGGGTITVSGNIVAEPGATLDVSGIETTLDLSPAYTQLNDPQIGSFAGAALVPTVVETNGGSISMVGNQELFSDAALEGFAGGPDAIGGTLTISSGRYYSTSAPPSVPTDVDLTVTQTGSVLSQTYLAGGSAIGRPVTDAGGNQVQGQGYFTVSSFENSGMASLNLAASAGGAVDFSGRINLTADLSLSVANGGVLEADSSVVLKAGFVQLGQAFIGPIAPPELDYENANEFTSNGLRYYLNPTGGSGSLLVEAQLIDVGNISMQGISNVTLDAAGGDIQGDGTLDVAGKITLVAGQIYPPTATTFNIIAYNDGSTPGEIDVVASGSRNLPLSAGGTLNLYATTIVQDGVLRAPFGTINIGWNGTGTSPIDPLTGAGFAAAAGATSGNGAIPLTPTAENVTLGSQSITSVSAIDPLTGQALLIPYGTVENSTSWFDPTGNNITAGGLQQKSITIDGVNITSSPGATIDVRGGGDLYAYQFVPGTGGTRDILGPAEWNAGTQYSVGDEVTYNNGLTYIAQATSEAVTPGSSAAWTLAPAEYAIIPSYEADFAPYAPYNTASTTDFTNNYVSGGSVSDYGYTSATLTVGSQVTLGASALLAAGTYTLLPARYALLPGAVLITAVSGKPAGTSLQPDGSYIVSGESTNGLDSAQTGTPLATSFRVESQAEVLRQAQYDNYSGDVFLTAGAIKNNEPIPSLPKDGGHLIIDAAATLNLAGNFLSSTPAGGEGAEVDITTSDPAGILIAAPGTPSTSGQLVINVAALNAFASDSLLIGGVRSNGADGVDANVTATQIQVEDSGTPLRGADITLAATGEVIIGSDDGLTGGDIIGQGSIAGAAPIHITGDGAAVRVGGNDDLSIIRTGVTSGNSALLQVGDGSTLSGGSLVLDSSQATTFGSNVTLNGQSIALNSGHIILNLDGNATNTSGALLLTSDELSTLSTGARSLSLLSYNAFDIYASTATTIGSTSLGNLTLDAASINGFDGGDVTVESRILTLGNQGDNSLAAGTQADAGTLTFTADRINLGATVPASSNAATSDQLTIGQYSAVTLNAASGVIQEKAGGIAASGNLTVIAPVITTARGVDGSISSAGALTIEAPAQTPSTVVPGGAGGELAFTGGSISEDSSIVAHSGIVSLEATTGDLLIGPDGSIDVSGVSHRFFDQVKYTDGGQVGLLADEGNVSIADPVSTIAASVNVSAPAGGGLAGSLSISAPNGDFVFDSGLKILGGAAGANGTGADFSLELGTLSSISNIASILAASGFNRTLDFRVENGDVAVDATVSAATFELEADNGSIDVMSSIDANNVAAMGADGTALQIGGSITLDASGDVNLESSGILDASAQNYSNAGQGGSVSISTTAGVITLAGTVKLGVAATPSGAGALQDVTGTLYLQAPQVAGFGGAVIAVNSASAGTDLNINAITVTITGASSITAAGVYVQDADTAGTASIDSMEAGALANADAFMANAPSISARLFGASAPANFSVEPSETIENTQGSLVLNNDWDLSTARYGTQMAVVNSSGAQLYDSNGNPINAGATPGFLTLRAAGSITFLGTLNDGFGDSGGDVPTDPNNSTVNAFYLEDLLPYLENNGTLQAQRSWSYQITAGADVTAANSSDVTRLRNVDSLSQSDSVLIGQDVGTATVSNPISSTPSSTVTDPVITGNYQVIRTGAGSINVAAAGNVQLLNQFATIYSAGAAVTDPTLGGSFDLPILFTTYQSKTGNGIGALYPAQYSMGGGDVDVSAGGDIEHLTVINGQLQEDSEKETPDNWLYRRGDLAASGLFDTGRNGHSLTAAGDSLSTTWWVDFSNFYEGVGALGGGNVSLVAGGSIDNVDAVDPTNARMPGRVPGSAQASTIAPGAANLVELGGGDVTVEAGDDIDGGVYYVEKGQGTLSAGGSIVTNETRAASPIISPDSNPDDWLPTTLFLGEGDFNVSARGDLLLGPVANPFLLPGGFGNSAYDKSYFSSYGLNDEVDVTSFGGDVTVRDGLTTANGALEPALELWDLSQYETTSGNTSTADYQPWLRIDETDVTFFSTVFTVMPAALTVTAFSGSVNIEGDITLSPSPTGTLDIEAADSINALAPVGVDSTANGDITLWAQSTIDLSDANPASIPGITSPLGYQSVSGKVAAEALTNVAFYTGVNALFGETGSYLGSSSVIQTKEALHTAGLLHAGDTEPVRLYAAGGSISGLTLFSAKEARIIASVDITDIAIYIQNIAGSNITLVSAGRDIIAYDPTAPLLQAAQDGGNALAVNANQDEPGDIQINGPGTLEVLAGRNLTMGIGTENADGTGAGITSIGNSRDPYLPFNGAEVVAAAGLGSVANGLESSSLDFKTFISSILEGPDGSRYIADLAESEPDLGITSLADFDALASQPNGAAQQDLVALELFYLVIRDAGRDHNMPGLPGTGNYDAGMAAIAALFPDAGSGSGDIDLTSREIKTTSGGNIDIIDPSGQLTVGIDIAGNQPVDQGILTEDGGNISIYTEGSVNVGTSRIFTLRGGNIVIWSSDGDVAAGASAKTVQSAPPTRVIVDPQSANVSTDLAGLATGGGIGVLATVSDVPPGSVDLIAPNGVIDAGDAGIRATGNLNLAAVQILNASNIQAGGASSGVPVVAVAAPNLGAIAGANSAVSAGNNPSTTAPPNNPGDQTDQGGDSIIQVQVMGYGGGDDSSG
jgi:filamentous hemagglutinin